MQPPRMKGAHNASRQWMSATVCVSEPRAVVNANSRRHHIELISGVASTSCLQGPARRVAALFGLSDGLPSLNNRIVTRQRLVSIRSRSLKKSSVAGLDRLRSGALDSGWSRWCVVCVKGLLAPLNAGIETDAIDHCSISSAANRIYNQNNVWKFERRRKAANLRDYDS